MQSYKNLGGKSNIVGFETDTDRIDVKFGDGKTYWYTYSSAGMQNVEEMKRLALSGIGLNSFINRSVRKNYAGHS